MRASQERRRTPTAVNSDLRDRAVFHPLANILADAQIFIQGVREILLIKPLRIPGFNKPETISDGITFLTQCYFSGIRILSNLYLQQ